MALNKIGVCPIGELKPITAAARCSVSSGYSERLVYNLVAPWLLFSPTKRRGEIPTRSVPPGALNTWDIKQLVISREC